MTANKFLDETYLAKELWEALVDDSLNDFTVDIGEPDAHHCADN